MPLLYEGDKTPRPVDPEDAGGRRFDPEPPPTSSSPATSVGGLQQRLVNIEGKDPIFPAALALAFAESTESDEDIRRAVTVINRMYDLPSSYLLGTAYGDMIDPETGRPGIMLASARRLREKIDANYIETILRDSLEEQEGGTGWALGPAAQGAKVTYESKKVTAAEIATYLNAFRHIEGVDLELPEALSAAIQMASDERVNAKVFENNLAQIADWNPRMPEMEQVSWAHIAASNGVTLRDANHIIRTFYPSIAGAAEERERRAERFEDGDRPIAPPSVEDVTIGALGPAAGGIALSTKGEAASLAEKLAENPEHLLELAEDLQKRLQLDATAFERSWFNKWVVKKVGGVLREVDQAIEGGFIFTGRFLGGIAGSEEDLGTTVGAAFDYANEGWHEVQTGQLNLFDELVNEAGLPRELAWSMQLGALVMVDPFIVVGRSVKAYRSLALAPGIREPAKWTPQVWEGVQRTMRFKGYVRRIEGVTRDISNRAIKALFDNPLAYFDELSKYRGKVMYGGRPVISGGAASLIRDMVMGIHKAPTEEARDMFHRLLKSMWLPDEADPVFRQFAARLDEFGTRIEKAAADAKTLTAYGQTDEGTLWFSDEIGDHVKALNDEATDLMEAQHDVWGRQRGMKDFLENHWLVEAPTRPRSARLGVATVTALEASRAGRRVLKTMSRTPARGMPLYGVNEATEWVRRVSRRSGLLTRKEINAYTEEITAAFRARNVEEAVAEVGERVYRDLIMRHGERIGFTPKFAEEFAAKHFDGVRELNSRQPSVFGKVERGGVLEDLTDVVMQPQLQNFHFFDDPLEVFKEMDEMVGTGRRLQRTFNKHLRIDTASKFNPDKFLQDRLARANRAFLAYWKPSVLLRIGYIPRVILIDEGLRMQVDLGSFLERMAGTRMPFWSRKLRDSNRFKKIIPLGQTEVSDDLIEAFARLEEKGITGIPIRLVKDEQGEWAIHIGGPQTVGYEAAAHSAPQARDLMGFGLTKRVQTRLQSMKALYGDARRYTKDMSGYDRVLQHVLANQIGNSPIGREVLLALVRGQSRDEAVDAIRALLNTKDGNKLLRESRRIGESNLNQWAENVVDMTYYYTGGSPQAAALALIGGGNDEKLMRAVIGESRLPEIHGPMVAHTMGFDPFNVRSTVDSLMRAFISAPDTALARMPYYRIQRQRAAAAFAEQIALTRKERGGTLTPQPPVGQRRAAEMTRAEYEKVGGPPNEADWFHGGQIEPGAGDFDEFDPNLANEGDLYGPGFGGYHTRSKEIAGGTEDREYGYAMGAGRPAKTVWDATPEAALARAQEAAAEYQRAAQLAPMIHGQNALYTIDPVPRRLPNVRAKVMGASGPPPPGGYYGYTILHFGQGMGGNVRKSYLDIQNPFDMRKPLPDDIDERIGEAITRLRDQGVIEDAYLPMDLYDSLEDLKIEARRLEKDHPNRGFYEGEGEFFYRLLTGSSESERLSEYGQFSLTQTQANLVFKEAGFDAFLHQGGRLTGHNIEHEVAVMLDPKRVVPAVGRDPHRSFVTAALRRGELVPSQVVADYPELAQEFAQQIPAKEFGLADLRRINTASREFALEQLKHIMYDFGESMRLDEVAGSIFPFVSAFKEGYKVWANLLVRRNPAAIPYARVVLKTAMDSGVIYEDPETGELMVKMDWFADMVDMLTLGKLRGPDDIGMSAALSSFNLFFASSLTENAFGSGLPIPAPGMSAPALMVLQHIFKDTESTFMQHWLFEYGPTTPGSLLPRWLHRAVAAVTPLEYQNAEKMRLANYFLERQQWRGEKPDPKRAERQADAFLPFMALVQFMSPAAPRWQFPQRDARAFWHDQIEKSGGDFEKAREAFLKRYPGQWIITQGMTVYEPQGVTEGPAGPRLPNTTFVNQLLRNPEFKAATKDPMFARWLAVFTSVGDTNGQGDQFDPAHFMAMVGSGDIRYRSPEERLAAAESTQFWNLAIPVLDEFAKDFDDLKAQGVDDDDPPWTALQQEEDEAIAEIGRHYPRAYAEYTRDDGTLDIKVGLHSQVIEEVKKLVQLDWFTAFPVGGAIKDWWTLREKTRKGLEEVGVGTLLAKNATELREAYDAGVADIIKRVPKFEQFFNLMLRTDLRSVMSKGDKIIENLRTKDPAKWDEYKDWMVEWESLRDDTKGVVTSTDLSNKLRAQFLHVVSNPEAQEFWWRTLPGWEQRDYKRNLATKRVIYMTPLDLRLLGLPNDEGVIDTLTYYSEARGFINEYLAANPDADVGGMYDAIDRRLYETALADPDFAKVLIASNTWGYGLSKSDLVEGDTEAADAWRELVTTLESAQSVIESADLHYEKYDPAYRAIRTGVENWLRDRLESTPEFKAQWEDQNSGFGGLLFDDLFPDTWFRLGTVEE